MTEEWDMLRNFLFKRPDWFKHEGYWRLAQVFRIGPATAFLLYGLICLVYTLFVPLSGYGFGDQVAVVAVWLGVSVVSLVSIHFLVRLIVWIREGFKEGD
jgi:membrane protein YdbS with pleckstrin-like domain